MRTEKRIGRTISSDFLRTSSSRRRSSTFELAFTSTKAVTNHIFTFRFVYFHALPILLSLGVSVEVYFLAANRELQEATESFGHVCEEIVLSVQLAWKLTVMQPDFLVALYFATEVPTRTEFERFTTENDYWNVAGTITEVEWVPLVKDADRSTFQADVQKSFPSFDIWSFDASGQKSSSRNHSQAEYCPITYDPGNDFILGLDLCNDPIEGPIIRRTNQTGKVLTAVPFLLRGLPNGTEFKMGTTLYMPIFEESPTTLTIEYTPEFVGVVVTVIHFQPLLKNILQPMDLEHLDIFLFDVGDTSEPFYLAHYESGPNDTMPHLSWDEAQNLTPDTISGDLVTGFTSDFDVPAIDRTFRIFVRARTNHYINKYRTWLPAVLLFISLFVKFFDKFMFFVEKKIYSRKRGQGNHRRSLSLEAAASNYPDIMAEDRDPSEIHRKPVSRSIQSEDAPPTDPTHLRDEKVEVVTGMLTYGLCTDASYPASPIASPRMPEPTAATPRPTPTAPAAELKIGVPAELDLKLPLPAAEERPSTALDVTTVRTETSRSAVTVEFRHIAEGFDKDALVARLRQQVKQLQAQLREKEERIEAMCAASEYHGDLSFVM